MTPLDAILHKFRLSINTYSMPLLRAELAKLIQNEKDDVCRYFIWRGGAYGEWQQVSQSPVSSPPSPEAAHNPATERTAPSLMDDFQGEPPQVLRLPPDLGWPNRT